MKRNVMFLLLLFVSSFSKAGSDGVTTTEIIQNSMSLSCIAWQPTGVCFWLDCKIYPPSCSVETSLKVRHYIPDAIVQVYQTPGEVPWEEMSFVSEMFSDDQTGFTPANTNKQTGIKNKDKKRKQASKIISRHVDIIGSPGLSVVESSLGSTEYGCESGVTPFQPYYVSMLDFYSWKYPYAEFLNPATFIPGMREVGEREDGEFSDFLHTGRFGNVYPRIGSLMQNDHYKANAVFAQRAADIVTSEGSLHIYNFLGESSSKDGWWPPGQIKEYTSSEGKWQMLYPYVDSECHIFGEPSTRSSVAQYEIQAGTEEAANDGYKHRRSISGNTVEQLWRPYECCEKKGQIFLFYIDINGSE